MEKEVKKIFNRQFERMKAELLDINMPQGYLTIISKYFSFAEKDVFETLLGYENHDRTKHIDIQ